MTRALRGIAALVRYAAAVSSVVISLQWVHAACAQNAAVPQQHTFFIDCSLSVSGDGSSARPWNSLADARAHVFAAGDVIALKRGTACHGSFAPQGSGSEEKIVRLTAYGEGPRPRIIATASDRQALLLFNQENWQIDSLDVSGSSTYGVFVSGDKGTLHHISLKNLFVHDVRGGVMKNKDNGLVVVGPSSRDVFFDDVLIDGVIAAHTGGWVGILVGGGPFPYAPDAPLNTHAVIRNSSVEDVQGDGIVLFRVSDGLIETSTAHETGMEPTQTVGTPNAIWTWTCTDCIVRDNEAYLTDSPGVDGGAYDIDWDDTRNTVERNYAHDTQGYCVAVFGAGFVTSQSEIRDNLCISNGLSPRLAAMQGAIYLSTWNGGVIHGLRIEHNIIEWNPPVASAAAIVNDGATEDEPVQFTGNRVETAASPIYRSNAQLAPSSNTYLVGTGTVQFTLGDRRDASLIDLQSAGLEKGSLLSHPPTPAVPASHLRLDAWVDLALNADGLLADAPLAQLVVLRSLAMQYAGDLAITVHLRAAPKADHARAIAEANALLDLDAASVRFVRDGGEAGIVRLSSADGRHLHDWSGFQNAATLGKAVRDQLGTPRYSRMESAPASESTR